MPLSDGLYSETAVCGIEALHGQPHPLPGQFVLFAESVVQCVFAQNAVFTFRTLVEFDAVFYSLIECHVFFGVKSIQFGHQPRRLPPFLLRRLQRDPELSGVDAVILDEVHERSLESDLLLAFLTDARAALREDLTLVAMSATLDADRLRDILGGTLEDSGGTSDAGRAPLVKVPGRLHPLEEVWAPPGRTGRLGPRGVPREFLAHVAATVEQALAEQDGDVLVFLPGAREVDDVVARLRAGAPGRRGSRPPLAGISPSDRPSSSK